uniref:Ovule protein n=1 Tax=Ascaris lumbricoides TaxID=6252 RepID=A0A0M3I912_ASCLU
MITGPRLCSKLNIKRCLLRNLFHPSQVESLKHYQRNVNKRLSHLRCEILVKTLRTTSNEEVLWLIIAFSINYYLLIVTPIIMYSHCYVYV